MLAWASCEGSRPPQGGDALRPWPSGAHRRWRNPGDAADRARHMGPQGSPGGQRGGGAERRGRPGCVTSTATGLDVQRAPGHSGHLGTTAIWVQRASGHHSHLGIVGIWAQQPSGRSGHLGTTACTSCTGSSAPHLSCRASTQPSLRSCRVASNSTKQTGLPLPQVLPAAVPSPRPGRDGQTQTWIPHYT